MNIRPGVIMRRTIPRTHLAPEEENHSDQEGAAHNQWWGQCRQIPEHAGLLYRLSSACDTPTWHCYLSPRMAGSGGSVQTGPAGRPAGHSPRDKPTVITSADRTESIADRLGREHCRPTGPWAFPAT